jgi:hypothetical protein
MKNKTEGFYTERSGLLQGEVEPQETGKVS